MSAILDTRAHLWHLTRSDGWDTTVQNTEMPRVRIPSVAGGIGNSSGRFFVLDPLVSPYQIGRMRAGMASSETKRTPLPTLGTGANRLLTHPEEDCSVVRWGTNQLGDFAGSHLAGVMVGPASTRWR